MTDELQTMRATAAQHAITARQRAYAPYSGFSMGAAVMTADGGVVEGVLIENVSLGLSMCAERVALFTAVTQRRRPTVLALCSERTEGEPTFPCGACLQVALEVAGPELDVVAVAPEGATTHMKLAELITRSPKRFTPDYDAGG